MTSQNQESFTLRSSSESSLPLPPNSTTVSRRLPSSRSKVASRTTVPRTAVSTHDYIKSRRVICAISESRGVSPTVGIAFIDLETSHVILCQICDSQTYVRTVQKLHVYRPSEILVMSSAVQAPALCNLISIIEENLDELDCIATVLDRRYWSERSGLEYIQNLAFAEDLEAIKIAVAGAYFSVCCLAAVLKYVEMANEQEFYASSLHIKFEPSHGSMMIDVSTVASLELIQNLNEQKSKDCLFGLLNATKTPMGPRLLRSNILQPLTNIETLNLRYDTLEELNAKKAMLFNIRQALEGFQDVDRLLTNLTAVRNVSSIDHISHNVNNIVILRSFITSVHPVYESLTDSESDLLKEIRQLCHPQRIHHVKSLVDSVINEDLKCSKSPLDIRNQQIFAIKTGFNGLLDVTRQAYKENSNDVSSYVRELSAKYEIPLHLRFDDVRQFYIRVSCNDLSEMRSMPTEFINVVKKNKTVEFSTLDLLKRNQKIIDAHQETILLSNDIISKLILDVREHLSGLFKISEAIAMLDMISAFAQYTTTQDCIRPTFDDTLAIQSGRHPIKEKIRRSKFIPNDIFASQQSRFQIITGCNMSGKSTYIRTIPLIVIMAQIGCFVPADYAVIPIQHQLFTRISVDDSTTANVSTFSAEMQEAAFILRNIDKQSIAIIDELGRGTSSRDGLAIAVAIAEALVESRALVWFATHFVELTKILAERNGVVSLHLAVNNPNPTTLHMHYKLQPGPTPTTSYGLNIARLFPLPEKVLSHARDVAQQINEETQRRHESSSSTLAQRRRRLVLALREHLVQARQGNMGDETLREWLEMLRTDFVERMVEIDADTELEDGPFVGHEEGLEAREDLELLGYRSVIEDDELSADLPLIAEQNRPCTRDIWSSAGASSSSLLLG